ncbi:MAG: hypothetical protein WC505_01230 [Patescibacteria group bacterium]
MDAQVAVFKDILCEEARLLISQCSGKITDRITWGRLLQHCRTCHVCAELFLGHHKGQIAIIAAQVINREVIPGHRYYALANVEMHFPKLLVEALQGGDLTDDEKALIAEHVGSCHECKQHVPSAQ